MAYKKGEGFRPTGREPELIDAVSDRPIERKLTGRPPGKKYPQGTKYRPKDGGVYEILEDAFVDPRGKITLRLKKVDK